MEQFWRARAAKNRWAKGLLQKFRKDKVQQSRVVPVESEPGEEIFKLFRNQYYRT